MAQTHLHVMGLLKSGHRPGFDEELVYSSNGHHVPARDIPHGADFAAHHDDHPGVVLVEQVV